MDGSNVVTPAPAQPAPQPVDVEKMTGSYVKLRDKIEEIAKKHEAELEPYKALRKKLEGVLLQHLNDNKTKSARTESGTITATTRSSATVKDTEAFRQFVIDQEEWDLADIRANAPAVMTYIEEKGTPVPGVQTSQMQTLSVRRA